MLKITSRLTAALEGPLDPNGITGRFNLDGQPWACHVGILFALAAAVPSPDHDSIPLDEVDPAEPLAILNAPILGLPLTALAGDLAAWADGVGTITCDACDGGGRLSCSNCDSTGAVTTSCECRCCDDHEGECGDCDGTGDYDCGDCDGLGKVNDDDHDSVGGLLRGVVIDRRIVKAVVAELDENDTVKVGMADLALREAEARPCAILSGDRWKLIIPCLGDQDPADYEQAAFTTWQE